MKRSIKVLGPGCSKCQAFYANALEAVRQSGVEAEVTKIDDIEEILKYNILTTPALVIDEVIKVNGRVADVNEIRQMLQ